MADAVQVSQPKPILPVNAAQLLFPPYRFGFVMYFPFS